MMHHNREAGAIAAFSGLATVALEGFSTVKLFAAFFIAIATGTGYKLGTILAEHMVRVAKDKAARVASLASKHKEGRRKGDE